MAEFKRHMFTVTGKSKSLKGQFIYSHVGAADWSGMR